MKKTNQKLIIIESICFIIGWLMIFLLGADKPPPVGFWHIAAMLVVLDIIQGFYLNDLLRNITIRPTFKQNTLLFILAGMLVSGITAFISGRYDLKNALIWIGVVTAVSILYGSFFWVVNWWIVKKSV